MDTAPLHPHRTRDDDGRLANVSIAAIAGAWATVLAATRWGTGISPAR